MNESKSKVSTVQELIHEQTELDRLFENAREEAIVLLQDDNAALYYGFQDPWDEYIDPEAAESFDKEIDLLAMKQLWESRDIVAEPMRDNLVKFCLGVLRRAGSDLAIDVVLKELGNRPHLTRSFCNYIAPFVRGSSDIQKAHRIHAFMTGAVERHYWQPKKSLKVSKQGSWDAWRSPKDRS